MMRDFIKYHSLGNDFILMDWLKKPDSYLQTILQSAGWQSWVRSVCMQHTGVGADGVLIIRGNIEAGSPEVLVYNADGSQGLVCLNGLRAVAQFLVTRRNLSSPLTIKMGDRNFVCDVTVSHEANPVRLVTMEMEQAVVREQLAIEINDEKFNGYSVSIGNPHYINIRSVDVPFLRTYGPLLESYHAFPLRTNVEFIWQDCHREDLYHLLVYERGCGLTNACSSGAAATLWLLFERNVISAGVKIEIAMPGGSVFGWVQDNKIYLQAHAVEVFSGSFAQDQKLH
ncbi:diaminopimelate epimerase [Candidatus Dependentiae bacterium]|nr:diaminopimelate epimerase [Candidatus Dependentiae bacterium]